MRKLATIRQISAIEPIPNADKIEVATVDGWQVVIRKGEFSVGELCVYCEVDSFLPIKPEFEFLRKSSYRKFPDGREGFRLKTIKMRGCLSQGLILPINVVTGLIPPNPETENSSDLLFKDVTNILGIVIYDPPIPACLSGKVIGLFPSFIPKTDEERFQNLGRVLPKYLGTKFYVTEKIDGTSTTIYVKDGYVGVCSRNLELDMFDVNNSYIRTFTEMGLIEKLQTFTGNIAIQGELVGPGIQKNLYKRTKAEIYVYGIFDIDTQSYLPYNEFLSMLNHFKLNTVPTVDANFTYEGQDLLLMADGKSLLNPELDREGLVFRTVGLPKFSFKSISNKFLLINED